jgi:hypothetical protein
VLASLNKNLSTKRKKISVRSVIPEPFKGEMLSAECIQMARKALITAGANEWEREETGA